MTAEPRRASRIRWALLVGALAQFALLYAPQPVLPQFAGAFGLNAGTAALLISAATWGLAVTALPLGTAAEFIGRRRTMVTALLVSELLGLLIPFVRHFPLLVGLRFVQGMAVAGLAAVVAAYLAEETGGERLGAAMGLYVAGTSLGGMSGRLVGGVVGDVAGWSGGLLAVAGLSGVCTLLFVVLLPAESRRSRGRATPLRAGFGLALRDPVLHALYLVAALGMGAFVSVYNVLGFRLISPPLSLSPALASLVFLAFVSGTVSSAWAGRLADRWGRARTLLVGLAVTAAGLVLMLAGALVAIVAGLVVFTGGFFAAHSVASGWVGARAREQAPGRVSGQAPALYQVCYYAGSGAGGMLGGWAYAWWGWPGMTLLLVTWLAVAAAGVGCVAVRRPLPAAPRSDQVASES